MPEVREVSAKSPKLGRETTILVNYGEDVDESIEMFGGDAMNSNAFANWTVVLQAAIRRAHKLGKTDGEIQELLKDAKMNVATAIGKDSTQATLAKFKVMSEEEKAAFIEKLKAIAAE